MSTLNVLIALMAIFGMKRLIDADLATLTQDLSTVQFAQRVIDVLCARMDGSLTSIKLDARKLLLTVK